MRFFPGVTGVLLLACGLQAQEVPSAGALRRHVEVLASDKFAGRGAPASRGEARRYIAGRFEDCGLEKIGQDWGHEFIWLAQKGVNVVGRLPGEGPLAARHIILSAHYDHLGLRKGKTFPGACDNASGVAALLELARRAKSWKGPRRSLIFVAFDLEEKGLLGSFAYAAKPPVPLAGCDFFLTADMLGRKSLGLLEGDLFLQGWEWTPGVLEITDKASKAAGTRPLYFWTDVTGDRSDFVAFKKKRVPHLFFTTGENEDYHRSSDTPDRMRYDLLDRHVSMIGGTLHALATRPSLWKCADAPVMHVAEFKSLQSLVKDVIDLKGSDLSVEVRRQLVMLRMFAAGVLKRDVVNKGDRMVLLRATNALQSSLR